MIPDSITIDGVTISREQWELFHVAYALDTAHLTWESFVAANTKPEHVKGERCTAPVWILFEDEAKEIDYFLFNELSNKLTPGEWYLTRDGMIGLAPGNYTATRWTLTAVPKPVPHKPAPKYDVGQWVALGGYKPVQITRVEWDGDNFFYYIEKNRAFTESHLRPATREDFMKEFGGVKVWMEKHDDERMREYFDGNSGSCFRWIDEWQITPQPRRWHHGDAEGVLEITMSAVAKDKLNAPEWCLERVLK